MVEVKLQKAFEPARSKVYGKKIGFWEAFSIGVGGMVGGGIFAVLGLTLYLARGAAPIAFFIAGLAALITAYSYAKLSIRFPSEGGTVEFLVQGFGNGFLAGWLNVLLLASYVIMITLYAYAFGAYSSSMIFGGENWFTRTAFAWFVIALFTLINALGAYVVGKVEDAMVMFKVAVLLLVGGAGLLLGNPGRLSPANWPPLLQVIAGGFVIFLAYEGFELIANTAKDVKDPEKTLPKAFYASVLFVMFLYIMVAASAAMNLTWQEVVKYKDYALAVAARPVFGELGFLLVGIAAVVSTASAINATLYGTARISYVVAKYGELPPVVGKRIWGMATEGLIVISIASALAVALLPLESISLAGSLGFLTIYAAVNFVNYKLREVTKANPALALLGFAFCLFAAVILITFNLSPIKLEGALATFIGSMLAELYVLKVKKVRLKRVVDKELEKRLELLKKKEEWVNKALEILKNNPKVKEVEVVDEGHVVTFNVKVEGEEIERIEEELRDKMSKELGVSKRSLPLRVKG